MTECSNNMTNLNQITKVDAIVDYSKACKCCGMSAIISAYVEASKVVLLSPLTFMKYLRHLPRHEAFFTWRKRVE